MLLAWSVLRLAVSPAVSSAIRLSRLLTSFPQSMIKAARSSISGRAAHPADSPHSPAFAGIPQTKGGNPRLVCWGIVPFPAAQQVSVITQHPEAVTLHAAKPLFRGFLRWFPVAGRLLVLIGDGKLLCQHKGGFLGADSFQTGNKVDHIPVCLTAETVKAPVNLHAWFLSAWKGQTHIPFRPTRIPKCSAACRVVTDCLTASNTFN